MSVAWLERHVDSSGESVSYYCWGLWQILSVKILPNVCNHWSGAWVCSTRDVRNVPINNGCCKPPAASAVDQHLTDLRVRISWLQSSKVACAKTHSSSLELQNTVWEMLYYEIGDFLAYKQLQPWAVFAPSSLRIPLTCTYHLLYSNPVSSAFSRPLKPHIFAHVIPKHH